MIFFWLGNGQSFWFCSQRLDLGVLPGLQCVLDPAGQVLRRAQQHRQRPAEKMRGYQAYGQPGTREGFHLSRGVWCSQLFCWFWEPYGRFCVIRVWTENQEWLGIVGRKSMTQKWFLTCHRRWRCMQTSRETGMEWKSWRMTTATVSWGVNVGMSTSGIRLHAATLDIGVPSCGWVSSWMELL